ncbi:MAG TPA: hypothetical protein VIL85_09710 [Thermomicrobiales bacterium]|jgi:hypothetical protein
MSDDTSGPSLEELDAGYATMAADVEYEAEALEWIESAPDDGLDDEGEDWSWLCTDAARSST